MIQSVLVWVILKLSNIRDIMVLENILINWIAIDWKSSWLSILFHSRASNPPYELLGFLGLQESPLPPGQPMHRHLSPLSAVDKP